MLDTIMIGTSGLLTHSKGLRVVGNNLANVNTPGFKGGQLEFANLVEQGAGHDREEAGMARAGAGLSSLGSHISFRAGLDQSTANPLDLSINGNGFYTLKRGGDLLYTRAGNFHFDESGTLVNAAGDHVQALGADGKLSDVTLTNLERSLPKATGNVTMTGNLNSTPSTADQTVALTVYDAGGAARTVNLTLKYNGGGDYTVTAKDADGNTLKTGTLKFAGTAVASGGTLSVPYTPPGGSAMTINVDFSKVSSLPQAGSIAQQSQDGYQGGDNVAQTVDADGVVNVKYTNQQTAKGARLALANVPVENDLEDAGGSAFSARPGARVFYGYAGTGDFGSLTAGHLEGSNVDMAEEFSNLILMQRGYQASSHVVSTANDMIQELFDMKGHR